MNWVTLFSGSGRQRVLTFAGLTIMIVGKKFVDKEDTNAESYAYFEGNTLQQ